LDPLEFELPELELRLLEELPPEELLLEDVAPEEPRLDDPPLELLLALLEGDLPPLLDDPPAPGPATMP
jgi:hypothetical protein